MLLGGAVGNAIDRAASGRVVDMFEFEFINFAVFNIADIFITFGGALFCLYVVLIEYKERHKKAPAASPPSGGGRMRMEGNKVTITAGKGDAGLRLDALFL
jgi:signal peptidase II